MGQDGPFTKPPTAGIVLIGNELLSGKIQDANGPYLISLLRRSGIDLNETHVVSDDIDAIVETVNLCRKRRDYCFTSGGIGPTHDDVTMAGIAAAFDVDMEERAELVTVIESYFGTGPKGKAWRKMASIPSNCQLIHTGTTWPLYTVENVYILPGIPDIFQRQADMIVATIDSVPIITNIAYFKIGEGELAAILTKLAHEYNGVVAIGSYPLLSHPDYQVKVTLDSRDQDALEKVTERLVRAFPSQMIHALDRNAG